MTNRISNKKLPQETRQEIADRYRSGEKVEVIALTVHCSISTAQRIAIEMGAPSRHQMLKQFYEQQKGRAS